MRLFTPNSAVKMAAAAVSEVWFVLLPSLVKFMRRTRAVIVIQKYRRMYVEKKRYRQKQAAALAMQTILRAYMARHKYQAVRSSGSGAAVLSGSLTPH